MVSDNHHLSLMTTSSDIFPPVRRPTPLIEWGRDGNGRSPEAAAVTDASPPHLDGPRSAIAAELRRRRRQLRLSQTEAAERAHVGRTVLSEIERGERVPSVRTYERLRTALGLDVPTTVLLARPAPPPVEEGHLARACACLIACRRCHLADLSEALGISVPAVRETLLAAAPRLARVGVHVVVDSVDAELLPLADAVDAIERLTTLENHRPLTGDQMEVVAILAVRSSATRRDIDGLRNGQESESVLRTLIRRGLVAGEDDPVVGGRHVYRLTTRGVAVTGHSSIESLQAHVLAILDQAGSDAAGTRQDATG